MRTHEFKNYGFYKLPMESGWNMYIFVTPYDLPNGLHQSVGKHGDDDAVAFINDFNISENGWYEADKNSKAFEGIGEFIIQRLFA